MSVKIRISYNTDEELAGVLRLLSPWVKSWKKSGTSKGKYRNAYADLHTGFQNRGPEEGAGCSSQ